jgi:hypothetical protein
MVFELGHAFLSGAPFQHSAMGGKINLRQCALALSSASSWPEAFCLAAQVKENAEAVF